MNSNLRHQTLTSNFCGYDFVSIRVDDVDYFPVSQLPFDPTGNQGFPVLSENLTRDLKTLLVGDLQVIKFATSLHSKKPDHKSLIKGGSFNSQKLSQTLTS